MAKYIAHASIDERGKASGGKAGDQTSKEVCIRTWYNKPWQYVLRIINEKVRKQFANNMIDIANNNNIGYDQSQRNTLLTQAEKVNFDFTKITTKCECDCSSSITAAILGAIYKINGKSAYEKAKAKLVVSSNSATTSTLRSRLKALDMITVYSAKEHIAGTDKAVFGDIYIKEGSHVVCYIDNGKKVSLTHSSSKNANVEALQLAINKDIKPKPLLATDGILGDKTKAQMKKIAIKKPLVGSFKKYPNIVKFIQRKVGVTKDGEFGGDTKKAVIKYQHQRGLKEDGVVGYNTLMKMIS